MAASHAIAQQEGNEVRSAMSLVLFDGVDTNGIGSTLGLTVVTTLDGVDVDASAALLYTSTAVQDNETFMDAAVAAMQAGLTGATVRHSKNSFDQYALHVEGIASVANGIATSLPVISVAA